MTAVVIKIWTIEADRLPVHHPTSTGYSLLRSVLFVLLFIRDYGAAACVLPRATRLLYPHSGLVCVYDEAHLTDRLYLQPDACRKAITAVH